MSEHFSQIDQDVLLALQGELGNLVARKKKLLEEIADWDQGQSLETVSDPDAGDDERREIERIDVRLEEIRKSLEAIQKGEVPADYQI